jgi:nicotinamide-nucleotide amidase
MRTELIFTGTELLLGQILNTNARFLAQRLSSLGLDLYYQTTVGDNSGRLAEVLRTALARADLIIVTGGLGPTMDDLTKETVAEALGMPLILDSAVLAEIEGFFISRGKTMPAANRKQAMVPEGSRVLPNARGTAPGVLIEKNGKRIILLPGPPVEMQPMFLNQVEPYLRQEITGRAAVIVSRVIKIWGLGESAAEEKIIDLVTGQDNPTIAFLAPLGEVYIRITAKAGNAEAAYRIIRPLEEEIRRRLGEYIFGFDEDTMASVVGRMLLGHRLTISLAESCTGGLIAKLLTDLPGSSGYLMYGVVAYSNEAKRKLLGVSAATLEKYGAVSGETAGEMAAGVRNIGGTDLALSVTGIAGPDGGTAEKPVGLVYIGFAAGDHITARKFLLPGDRETVRRQTANAALNMIRLHLLGK